MGASLGSATRTSCPSSSSIGPPMHSRLQTRSGAETPPFSSLRAASLLFRLGWGKSSRLVGPPAFSEYSSPSHPWRPSYTPSCGACPARARAARRRSSPGSGALRSVLPRRARCACTPRARSIQGGGAGVLQGAPSRGRWRKKGFGMPIRCYAYSPWRGQQWEVPQHVLRSR